MKNKVYLHWGLTVTLSVCAILVFYDTFFHNGVLLRFAKELVVILKPVLYGLAMAYLLTPIVNLFDRLLSRYVFKDSMVLVRVGSVFLTWVLVLAFLYLLFSMLIPQLVASVETLIANLETYYKTIYNWVVRLFENNPELSGRALDMVRSYYNELVDWVYNSVIPQAQVAIVAVTGGIVSVVVFLKDFFVGICVSLYLLGRKETFAANSRKLLYVAVSEPTYERSLRAIRAADRIFSGFVRGKLLDSLIIGILCFIVSSILRFPYTPLVSVIVGVTNVIPFFGPFLGAVPSAFLILLVSPRQCLYFIIFVIILQQFDGNFLGPKILGDSTGLSGFWVIVAILVGGGFGGVLGMFLGVPVLACIYAAVKNLSENALKKRGITDDTMFYGNAEKSISTKKEEDESND